MSESVTTTAAAAAAAAAAGTVALPTYDTIMKVEGVELYRHNDPHHGHWYVVDNYDLDHQDNNRERVRLTFYASDSGISIGVHAEWSNDEPGNLTNYPPMMETGPNYFAEHDDVSVSDDGVLTALASVHYLDRERSVGLLDMRVGFVARLRREFVAPVRQAIGIVRDEAKLLAQLSREA